MENHAKTLFCLGAALLAWPTAAASASPLALTNVTAAQAAAQIGARCHAQIVLKENSGRPVSLTLEDADAPGARLQTVNALACAVGLDFTKTFVVDKSAAGQAEGAVMDSSLPIPFGKTTLPVRDAIARIAGADAATAQIGGDVSGTITLSAPTLTGSEAAAQIARQAHVSWKTVYVIARRDLGGTADGQVVGYTGGGSPIVELAYVPVPDLPREAQQRREQEAAERVAAQQQEAYQKAVAQQALLAQQQAAQQNAQRTAFNGQGTNGAFPNGPAMYGNGYSPYNNLYNPYGYPYGYGYSGSPAFGGYSSAYAGGYSNSGYSNSGYFNNGYANNDYAGGGIGVYSAGSSPQFSGSAYGGVGVSSVGEGY